VAAVDAVETYLGELPALRARRLAHGEWGLTIPGEELGGEPLDVGLRIADGLLRAQAVAVHAADFLDPWMLLWWNRQTRLVRFGCSRSRDIWIHADLPAAGVDERALDRLLGLVAEAAVAVRAHAGAAATAAAPPADPGATAADPAATAATPPADAP
jgi:Putative bacterial sensory transduction regulator